VVPQWKIVRQSFNGEQSRGPRLAKQSRGGFNQRAAPWRGEGQQAAARGGAASTGGRGQPAAGRSGHTRTRGRPTAAAGQWSRRRADDARTSARTSAVAHGRSKAGALAGGNDAGDACNGSEVNLDTGSRYHVRSE